MDFANTSGVLTCLWKAGAGTCRLSVRPWPTTKSEQPLNKAVVPLGRSGTPVLKNTGQT